MAGRQALRLLVTPGRRDALERLVLHATTLRIPVVEIEGGSLTAVTGFDGHQGVALVVAARPPAAVADVLARAIERGEPAFVLALDSLEDPQNVGTLLRSAEAAGVHGVVFPTRRQAPLSPAAVKASAGATEHLLLAPVDDLPGTLADLHARGLRVVGTDAEATLTYREADLRGPLVLVIGSEGRGLCARDPPTVRSPGPDPDARPDRVAQRGRRWLGAPLRVGRAARARRETGRRPGGDSGTRLRDRPRPDAGHA